MIELDVEPYCQDCLRFAPKKGVVDCSTIGKKRFVTAVYCEHNQQCEAMYECLKERMQNEH